MPCSACEATSLQHGLPAWAPCPPPAEHRALGATVDHLGRVCHGASARGAGQRALCSQPHRLHRKRCGPEPALACRARLQMYNGSEGPLVRSARLLRQSLQVLRHASWACGPCRCQARVDQAGGLRLQGVVEIPHLPLCNENRRLWRSLVEGAMVLAGHGRNTRPTPR
jgi:hypothetical protein